MKYSLIKSRKENTTMEKNKKISKAKNGIHATLETGWAIGASIAGTQVL
ncbi:hypothetical protein HQN84_06155 [Pedobacter steynii]|nr:hypothetical protein [Pedobacter steynii]NQX38420.1 hypothetical protein [Pedobacter steynii]